MVAGIGFLDVLGGLFRVHQQACGPMRSLRSLVELITPVPLSSRPEIDAAERDGADEGVVHNLEGKHRQRLGVGRTAHDPRCPLLSMPLIGGTSSGDGR